MRKITLLFAVLLVARILSATNVTHTFFFDFNNFKLSSIGDSIEIASTKSVAVYPNFDEPGLPIVARSIGNIDFETVKDFSLTVFKHLVCRDVDIRKSPIPLPTNVSVENAVTQGGQYPKRIYPDSNCTLQKSYNIGGVEITNFLISPFVYDAAARELYFVDSLVVDMDMESIDFSTVNLDRPIRQNQIDMISAIIENPEILESIPVTYADESNNIPS